MEEKIVNTITTNLKKIKWSYLLKQGEVDFNKTTLEDNIKNCFGVGISTRKKELTNNLPLFGYSKKNTQNSKADSFFIYETYKFGIENKLIQKSREYDIGNSIAQSLGYFNKYKFDFFIITIFDNGRAKNRVWGKAELKFLSLITSNYPIWVVRIREKNRVAVYGGEFFNKKEDFPRK